MPSDDFLSSDDHQRCYDVTGGLTLSGDDQNLMQLLNHWTKELSTTMSQIKTVNGSLTHPEHPISPEFRNDKLEPFD